MKYDADKERRRGLYAVPVGLTIFGLGGGWALYNEWKTAPEDVLPGLLAGIVVSIALALLCYKGSRIKFSRRELTQVRNAHLMARSFLGFFVATGVTLSWWLRGHNLEVYFMAFFVPILVTTTVIAGLLAYHRKGLDQRS